MSARTASWLLPALLVCTAPLLAQRPDVRPAPRPSGGSVAPAPRPSAPPSAAPRPSAPMPTPRATPAPAPRPSAPRFDARPTPRNNPSPSPGWQPTPSPRANPSPRSQPAPRGYDPAPGASPRGRSNPGGGPVPRVTTRSDARFGDTTAPATPRLQPGTTPAPSARPLPPALGGSVRGIGGGSRPQPAPRDADARPTPAPRSNPIDSRYRPAPGVVSRPAPADTAPRQLAPRPRANPGGGTTAFDGVRRPAAQPTPTLRPGAAAPRLVPRAATPRALPRGTTALRDGSLRSGALAGARVAARPILGGACAPRVWYDPWCHTRGFYGDCWSFSVGYGWCGSNVSFWYPWYWSSWNTWNTCYYDTWWASRWAPACLPTSYWWYPTGTYCPTYLYVPSSTVVIVDTPAAAPGEPEVVVAGGARAGRADVDPLPPGGVGARDLPPEALARKYVELGDYYFQADRFAEALDAYQRARGYAPNDASLHFVLADAAFATGDYHYAAYLVGEALRLDPAMASADTDKRLFYKTPAPFEAQMQGLDRYLEAKPYDALAHLVRGYNLRFSGRPVQAVGAFRRVLEIDPGNRAAQAFLATLEPTPPSSETR